MEGGSSEVFFMGKFSLVGSVFEVFEVRGGRVEQ